MVSLVEMREEWRFVWEDSGEQCVMTHGTILMLQWCADSLDSEQQVLNEGIIIFKFK